MRRKMTDKPATYERIKDWIFVNSIPPGTRMVEQTVAAHLGLSRAPVREAFQRLHNEGFLVKTRDKGLELRSYTEQSLVDLFTYREYLDGMATRLFSLRAEDVEIKYIRMLCNEMEQLRSAYDYRRQREKDLELHLTISRGARNERILIPHRNVLQECYYITGILFSDTESEAKKPPERLEKILGEHERILAAVSARDPDEAERVARESVRNGLERAMQALAKWTGPR
jgi:DNA-binding GntR family transcriptional regulator